VPLSELIWIVLLGLTSGLLIGCIGIGGVLLVPSLVFLAQIPIQIVIPAAMMAYIPAGIVGTAVFAHNKSIRWGMAVWLCLGAAPTAFAGAWVVGAASPRLLEIALGLLTILSGFNSLRSRFGADCAKGAISNTVLLIVGSGTGLLSSVSGTGGPLVLVPVLITLSVPVLTAVGLSQAIQLPIAVAATLGNILYGHLDPVLGGVLAGTLTVGAWFGAKLAHVVPRAILQRIVSVVLIAVGAFIFANVGWHLLK
jgi:uncharacterized protein